MRIRSGRCRRPGFALCSRPRRSAASSWPARRSRECWTRAGGGAGEGGAGGGGGGVVTISMNEQTMTRRGFVPYGPSGAAVEALGRVIAADLDGTPVRATLLLPGGATATGMIPEEMPEQARAGLLDPAIMGPPIVWLASPAAAGVHDQRIVANRFEEWLAAR